VAQQRNNPDFSPTRIFQPAASPVDTYFRPNLAQPELPKSAEIYKALAELSPKLSAISSDVAAFGIRQEQQAGAMEVSTATSEADLQRKVAQAIEKSGGFAPWRAQATLEAAGERMVMDNYSKALYENLDALSEPTNPDGSMKNPEEIAKRKEELFNQVGLSPNSYYMQKAAYATKQKVDAQFDSRVIALRTEKLKRKNDDDLSNSMIGVWSSTDSPDEAMAKTAELLNQHYQKFGVSGYENAMTTFVKWAKGEAAAGNYDEPMKLIAAMGSIAGKGPQIGGLELPARFSTDLRLLGEDIESDRNRYEDRAFARTQRERAVANDLGRDQVGFELAKMNADNTLPSNYKDLFNIISDIAKKYPNAQPGELQTYATSLYDKYRSPQPSDRETMSYLEQLSRTMPMEQFRPLVYAAMDVGSLNPQDQNRLLTQAASIDSALGNANQEFITNTFREVGLNNWAWSGAEVDDETKLKLDQAAASARNELLISIADEAGNLKKDYVNRPAEYQRRIQSLARTRVAEYKKQMLLDNADLIKAGTLNAEAAISNLSPGPSGIEAFSLSTPGWMGITKKVDQEGNVDIDYSSVSDEVRQHLMDTLTGVYNNTQGSKPQKEVAVLKAFDNEKKKIRAGVRNGDFYFLSEDLQKKYVRTPQGDIQRPSDTAAAPYAGQGPQLVKAAQDYAADPNPATASAYSKQRLDAYNTVIGGLNKIASPATTIEMMSSTPNKLFGGMVTLPGYENVQQYQIKTDGVYTPPSGPVKRDQNGEVIRQFDPASTATYKLGVSFRGLTPEEINSGKTREGFTITDDMLDWKSNILFPSVDAFSTAYTEYRDNKTGPIASYLNKIGGKLPFDLADFGRAQVSLFKIRHPSASLQAAPPQAPQQNTVGTESSI